MLVSRGGTPAAWKRLTGIGTDTLDAWPRFLRQHKLVPEAQRFATTYEPATWWTVRYVRTAGTAEQRAEEWRVRVWPDGKPLDARHIVPDSATRATADSAALRRIALAALARDGVDTSKLEESEVKETARPARRDVTVTYTDTAVELADSAAARAWVQIAGDEPLVARRGIELPEAFLRADRARQTTRMLITGVSVLLLFGLVVTGAIVVKRSRPIIVDDGTPDRRQIFIFVGALVVLGALGGLNSLPSQLFRYDTTQPWGSFLTSEALGFVVSIVLALIVVGLLLALNAMRRRAGIPMLPAQSSRSPRNDMLVAGLGLGGIIYAMSRFDALVPRVGMPRPPTTTLNDAWPLFSGVPDLPISATMMVAMVGIPLLVVAGLTQRWSLRILSAATIGALAGTLIWMAAPAGDVDPARVALVIAGVAIVVTPIIVLGRLSAWSWIIAALFYRALDGLREGAYGPVWQARGSGALSVLVASALVALIAYRVTHSAGDPKDALNEA
jgi:hypothetical protein